MQTIFELVKRELQANSYHDISYALAGLGTTCFLKEDDDTTRVVAVINNINEQNAVGKKTIANIREHCASLIAEGYNADDVLCIVINGKDSGYGSNTITLTAGTGARGAKKHHILPMYEDAFDVCKKTVQDYEIYHLHRRTFNGYGDTFDVHSAFAVYVLVALTAYLFFATGMALGTSTDIYGISAKAILKDGQAYRFISYMFMHGSMSHLFGNMLVLFVIGKQYCQKNGTGKFITIYFVGGIYAGIISIISAIFVTGIPERFTIGASGAIFAIVAAHVTNQLLLKTISKGEAARYLLLAIVISALSGGNVDNACHMGGAFAGICLELAIHAFDDAKYNSKRADIVKEFDRIQKLPKEGF